MTTTTIKEAASWPCIKKQVLSPVWSHLDVCGESGICLQGCSGLVGFCLFVCFVSCMRSPIKWKSKHFKTCTFSLKNPCNPAVYCNIRRFGHSEHLFQMASSEHPADLQWPTFIPHSATLPGSCRLTWLCCLLTEWLKLSSRLLTWIQVLRDLVIRALNFCGETQRES